MKKILKFAFLPLLFIAAASCTNDDAQAIASPEMAPQLISPEDNTSVVLTPELEANTAFTLVWNHAGYDVATSMNYEVQMAVADGAFTTIGTTSNRVYSMNVADFNSLAVGAGAPIFEPTPIKFKVVSSLGDNSDLPMESNIITLNVTTYTTEAPKVYITGNFVNASGYGADWTPSAAVAIAAEGFGETAYEGYVYMNVAAPEFKVLPTNTSFDGDYGMGSAPGILVQEGESNIPLTAPGYYRILADTDALTYSAVPTVWGIVGAATPGGWDNSTSLTYNQTTKVWEGDIVLTAGEFKFRANNAWDINLGPDSNGDGFIDYGGGNLSVAAGGNYHVVLDLSHPRQYTYTLTAN